MNGIPHQRRPVVIVTGANSGVGFGICHRLLLQLSRSRPSDALPQPGIPLKYYGNLGDFSGGSYDGLTLILACRSVKRAEAARTQLLDLLAADIIRQRRDTAYDGHAEIFRDNLHVVVHYVDLAIVQSIFEFGKVIRSKYPYVSHLICNAGVASFCGMDWWKAAKQLLLSPVEAVTSPVFKLQNQGELSVDGLGWVWQCNVFGHYVMFRTLEPVLKAFKGNTSYQSRVIWMSSIEALPEFYEPEDWQLVKTDRSYECSKFQIDLLAGYLEDHQRDDAVKHILVAPGVVATNIASNAINYFLVLPMVLAFYLARFLGSPNHPIDALKSGISAVHLSLMALATESRSNSKPMDYPGNGHTDWNGAFPQVIRSPPKFSSETSMFGKERVGVSEIKDWGLHQKDSVRLAEQCEGLYQTFLKNEQKCDSEDIVLI